MFLLAVRPFRSLLVLLVGWRPLLSSAGSKPKSRPAHDAPYEFRAVGGLRDRYVANETCTDGHNPLASMLQELAPKTENRRRGRGRGRELWIQALTARIRLVRAAERQCNEPSAGSVAVKSSRSGSDQLNLGGAGAGSDGSDAYSAP